MGRPREHNEDTRAKLIAAAEVLVAEGGPDALSVRAVATAAATTTRAVYSLFSSRDGLVDALAEQAFGYLGQGVAAFPETDDPAEDLVRLGSEMYRGFVTDHPSLFRIAFQRVVPEFELSPELVDVRRRVWAQLEAKVERLQRAGLLSGRSLRQATVEFNVVCEGLGNAELRGGTLRREEGTQPVTEWRDALRTMIDGFRSSPTR